MSFYKQDLGRGAGLNTPKGNPSPGPEEKKSEKQAQIKKCSVCMAGDAEPVYNATRNQLAGWWCQQCGFFDKAILRERRYKL